MAKKTTPSEELIRRHTTALRQHTQELKRLSNAITKAAAAHGMLADALEKHTAALEASLPKPKRKLSRKEIKRRLAQATSNSPEALRDSNSVTGMIGGDGPVANIVMSKINQAFWPGVATPHITFKEIKDMNIGQLVELIEVRLG
jgi:hypothetical protein